MTEYVKLYADGKKEISLNIQKGRIYARFNGSLSESHFNQGQRVLNSAFALLAAMEFSHIDYVLDLRFGLPFSEAVLKLWKEKGFQTHEKYPQLRVAAISEEQSPLWVQISEQQELLDRFEGRTIAVFKTREEADTSLDRLRGYTEET
jgi:hypothetical protein